MTKYLKEKCIQIYLILMLLVFPLFYRNNYMDILRAKRDFYIFVTLVTSILMCILILCKRQKLIIDDRYTLVFGVLLCIALFGGLFCTEEKADAFLGLTGRYLGICVFLLGIVMMFFISQYLSWNVWLTWAYVLGVTCVYILQILNEWQIDILGMNRDVSIYQQWAFISTLGNVNFNASFDCMMIAPGMVFFILAKDRLTKWIFAIHITLGFMAGICCRSESFYLGLAAAFFILILYGLINEKIQNQIWIEVGLWKSATLIICIFYNLFADRAYPMMDEVAGYIMRPKMWGIGFAALIVIWGLWYILKRRNEKVKKLVCRSIIVLSGLVLFIACGIFFYVNVISTKQYDGILAKLQISDEWGSGRGYIWKKSIQIFGEYPVINKLFGCGMNCYSYVVQEKCGAELMQLTDAYFIDAHNEFLQILVTTGIVGFIGYFGMIFTVLIRGIYGLKDHEYNLFIVAGLVTFLVQGLVNNPQITTVPYLFLSLGIYERILKTEKSIHI